MKRVLFVDDDPQLLAGLQRMFYPFRREWQVDFAAGGLQALKMLDESRYDVLVTDVRMPGMNGIELLQAAAKRFPGVMRFVLSGAADRDLALRSVELAHQFLTKPCEPAVLRDVIDRALNLRLVLEDPALRLVVASMRALPSIPGVYVELMNAIRSPETPASELGSIVARDAGMTAKVLQLVNSSFFGIRRAFIDPVAATVYLGAETVGALVLQASVFSQFSARTMREFPLEALQQHSGRVAATAQKIAADAGLTRVRANECMAAGLLHDLGKLVLVSSFPEQYRKVLRDMEDYGLSAHAAELQEFGTSHAEVGAYLLWLWGIPDVLTEAVALHHNPPPERDGKLSPATVVYIANTLDSGRAESPTDVPYPNLNRVLGEERRPQSAGCFREEP